ncbi:hypothetical protein [Ferrovibrio sp.]|uniref:hypothetical protein n=1 Tax=Ferrovibrio sp. TaxID=1917215 RepID=UPI0025BC4EC7|nr:hypothetical protein [Ferrovibrio sp.]MBX3453047.1 hypothetical protein [Ferrovibrio sp.]
MTRIGEKTYSKAEIEALLQAMDRQTKRAAKKAEGAIERITKSSFEPYYEYRESLTEIEGVLVLIENRMAHADPKAHAQLAEYHTNLVAGLLKMKIDVILRVFPALEIAATLPMGAQRVFLATLWELKETVARIDRLDMSHLLDEEARKRLLVAETIIGDVAQRAPALLELAEQHAKQI